MVVSRAKEGANMRSRHFATIWAALLCAFAIAIAGCGQAPTANEPEPSTNEPEQTSSGKDEPISSDTATMGDYLHEHYGSFDEFNEGIQSGKSIPVSLRVYAEDETDGYVYDKDVIVDAWNQLCAVRIDLDNPTKEYAEDGYFVFDFDSGREVIPFPFCTTEYADFSTGELYPVQNPEEVGALLKRLTQLAEQNMPNAGDELTDQNGAYLWDADGDGMLEHMWLDFNGNGDEAASGYTIRVFDTELDATEYLDNVYEIKSVVLQQDSDGYYVLLKTDGHDYTVRLVDSELMVEEAK